MKFSIPLLKSPADRRTLLLLALLSAAFVFGWRSGSPLWLIPCTILAITACCAKHNHTHRAIFQRRFLNRLMDYWLTLLTGGTTTGIRVAHQVRHHGANQSPEDFVRCGQVRHLPPLRALAVFVPRVILRSWRRTGTDFQAVRRRGLLSARRREAAILWAFILIMLVIDPWRFLMIPVIPWLLSQWFLIAVNLPQHDGCDVESALAHSRNSTGRVTNWLFLNNGYHTAHHGRPGCHWSLLPALHEQARAAGLPRKLDCPSFAAFWISWWRERRKEARA